jgi:S-DNA-T family DNA segregation ATPase FtsK/SpoIIIE
MGEVAGIILLGCGLLHFLALASFNAYDLPTWARISPATQPNDPVQNLIGPTGAILAGYSLFAFGVAAYLIPIGFIWFGISKLSSRLPLSYKTAGGFLLFLLSGACLAQIQPFFFENWQNDLSSLGPGGGAGYFLGERLAVGIIGQIGALILLLVIYTTGLVMMTGMHPVAFLVATRKGLPGAIAATGRCLAGLARGLLRLATGAGKKAATPETTTARRKATPEPKLDTVPEPEPEVASGSELPEPKIIDASAPRRAEDDKKRKKKTLAELRKELHERKKSKPVTNNPTPSLAEAFSDFELPPLDILHFAENDESDTDSAADKAALWETQTTIVKTLATFGVKVSPGDITKGPTITRFEVYPSEGLRVNRITALEQDIALATKAEAINILAPIPGRSTVGIEIANNNKIAVTLRELLEDPAFAKSKARIPLALGKDVYGKTIVGDLAAMPHLLVSGATGAGKSVCINSIIASLLYRFTPEEMRFIMVDPKVVEMQAYQELPHLAIPLVTEPKKVLLALRWVVKEMENRYQMFKRIGVKDFDNFNKHQTKSRETAAQQTGKEFARGENSPALSQQTSARGLAGITAEGDIELEEAALAAHPVRLNADGAADYAPPPAPTAEEEELPLPDSLPYVVVIIDELADLMDTAPADVEMNIVRIAQMARAAGIHLILATQTPRAEVITGRIRANVPTKIAFRVSSGLESRVILDTKGAERLVGKGDMLYLAPGAATLTRAQGALVTEDEIRDLVTYLTEQASPVFEAAITESIENGALEEEEDITDEDEETLEKCFEVIRQEGKASASMLQRRLRLGYNRASRMMDIMESRGIVGPGDGARPREILIDLNGELD